MSTFERDRERETTIIYVNSSLALYPVQSQVLYCVFNIMISYIAISANVVFVFVSVIGLSTWKYSVFIGIHLHLSTSTVKGCTIW